MTASKAPLNTDDIVIPFQVEQVEASGRLVRMGPAIDEIITRHAYPEKISEILGQALLLVALFGSMIKDRQSSEPSREHGSSDERGNPATKERFILQTRSDGIVNLIVADYVHPGELRGYVRFDTNRLDKCSDEITCNSLLGKGHLAMTIDRGSETDRYQGIVALSDEGPDAGLCGAANLYFEQSEQLPTYIQLAMARHFDAMDNSGNTGEKSDSWHWRGGGLMVQKLTSSGGHDTPNEPQYSDLDDDSWTRALLLSQTIKDHELLDPVLSSRDLLLRLYHEDGVRVFEPLSLKAQCSCSLEGVTRMLAGFSPEDQKDMVEEDGKVHITCEFCNRAYALSPMEQ